MKDTKFYKIFKTKADAPAIPDLSAYTDDILGPSMSNPVAEVPEKIRMLNRKRKVAPFLDSIKPNEEENEEGELDSDIAPELSNHEQSFQHGFNPNTKQKAEKWDQFKKVDIATIPRIVTAGVDTREPITPTFHQVKDLPDHVKGPVRAIGKQLFSMITTTPVENIQVVANVGGNGPNSEEEVIAVEDWIHHAGHQDHELIRDLEKKISGLALMHTEGITYLQVENSAGRFVFCWPSVDNHIGKGTV